VLGHIQLGDLGGLEIVQGIHFKGKPVPDEASKVCVLFDPTNGRVVHVHGVTVLEGGRSVSEAEIEKRALEHAATAGHSASALKPLHVSVAAIRQGGILKVNREDSSLTSTKLEDAAQMSDLVRERVAKARTRANHD